MTMLDAYPFDLGVGSNSGQVRWQKVGKVWQPSGVVPGATNGLGGELAPSYASGAITVANGGVYINGTYGELANPVTVASPGNGLLVARLDNANYQLILAYNQNATVPVQTNQTWELPLASLSGSTLTDLRVFTGPPVWRTYTPYWTLPGAANQPVLGNGSLQGRYLVRGKLCQLRIVLSFGSSTFNGSTWGTGWNAWKFGLPPNVWTPNVGFMSEEHIPMKYWSPGPEGIGGLGSMYFFANDNGGFLFGDSPDTARNIIYMQAMNWAWGYPNFVWQPGGNIVVNGSIEIA